MRERPQTESPANAERFAEQAREAAPGMVRELWDFLRYNKKWWLAPIILVLIIVGLVIILGSGVAGPFIYTLF